MKKEVAKQLVKFFDKKMKQLEGTENKLEPVPDNILKMIDDAKKRSMDLPTKLPTRKLKKPKLPGKPRPPIKPTKKKSGGRLSDGTAFINSLYKDKM